MRSAHILLMPAEREPLGFVALEALGQGLAVICHADAGAAAHVAAAGGATVKSVEELVEELRRLHANTQKLEQMRQSGADYARLMLSGTAFVGQLARASQVATMQRRPRAYPVP